MVSIFFNDFKGFILPRAELVLAFLENGLELGPEAILEMGKLEIFVGFVFAGTRNFGDFFFINDTSVGISWKWMPSFLDFI